VLVHAHERGDVQALVVLAAVDGADLAGQPPLQHLGDEVAQG